MSKPNDAAAINRYHLASSVEQLKRDTEKNAVLPELLCARASENHEVKGIRQIRAREKVRDLIEFAVEIRADLQRRVSTPSNS